MNSLSLRSVLNAGRNYTPLSVNAKKILKAGRPQPGWFNKFFADHPGITEKQQCSEEILRAKWMTPMVSMSHFEKLGALLDRIGLRDEHRQILDPRRVLNSDECPNPWRGTGDRGKVIAEVGTPCLKLVSSARQHTSLDVLVGMDGHLYGPHIIFQGAWVQRQMIPRVTDIP